MTRYGVWGGGSCGRDRYGNLKEIDRFEDVAVDGRIILKIYIFFNILLTVHLNIFIY